MTGGTSGGKPTALVADFQIVRQAMQRELAYLNCDQSPDMEPANLRPGTTPTWMRPATKVLMWCAFSLLCLCIAIGFWGLVSAVRAVGQGAFEDVVEIHFAAFLPPSFCQFDPRDVRADLARQAMKSRICWHV